MADYRNLEKKLKEEAESFRVEGNAFSEIIENSNESPTWEDIREVYRQTFYVFDKFQKHIIDYLREVEQRD